MHLHISVYVCVCVNQCAGVCALVLTRVYYVCAPIFRHPTAGSIVIYYDYGLLQNKYVIKLDFCWCNNKNKNKRL